MKRVLPELIMVSLLAGACSGGVSRGGNAGDNGGGQSGSGNGGSAGQDNNALGFGPKSPASLERNTNDLFQISCSDPNALNTGPAVIGRLTNIEYWNTLKDLLSAYQLTAPTLPAETIQDGFKNNADGQGPTDTLIEGLEGSGLATAKIVAADLGKLGVDGCPPANQGAEMMCVDSVLDGFGKRAYRRPLANDEKDRLRGFFTMLRGTYDFAQTMEQVVNAMLQSPQFLYKIEKGQGDADRGAVQLAGYEMASRLSYLLWDTMPDQELFSAAADGQLDKPEGLVAQVGRMIGDARTKSAVGEFASQWLELDRLAGLSATKDPKYTLYNDQVAADVQTSLVTYLQETLAPGGVREFLTSHKAWVNARVAPIYDLTDVQGDNLRSVDVDSNRRAGIFTQVGMMAGLAHKANHAPVLRGQFILKNLLCAPPPPPPMGMIPPAVNPMPNAVLTTRQRLVMEHEGQGSTCKSCHQFIDGAGFAFEHYDAIGKYQDTEFNMPVDPSAKLTGTYDADGDYPGGIMTMTDKLAGSEQVAQCVVDYFFRYTMARSRDAEDGCTIAYLTDHLVDSQGDFKALVEALVKTPAFRYRKEIAQ